MDKAPHLPVLYQQIIHALQPTNLGFYVDGTVGAGGHARGILEACAPEGRLLGLDVDPQALALCRETLAPYGERARLVQASYTSLSQILRELGWPPVNGIVLDLGASSMQFDTPERGFSFIKDGPLDMRFNPNLAVSAANMVNDWHENELADIIFRYGEEPAARRIAQAIVRARPVEGTRQLTEIIARAVKKPTGRIHPATRTFQALRIAVNDEMNAIEAVLPKAMAALVPGGRLAIISFHSLEDRLVKTFFRQESRDCLCPPKQPVCTCGHTATLKEITRKPIVPDGDEIDANSRARSAKLRIAEKVT